VKLTKELIYGFAGSVLSTKYDNPVPTPWFHLEWWDLCCSDDPLVAIAAPRGHAKSTAITHTYVLASVLFRDRSFVIIVSYTEGQAVEFLRDIKKELTDNHDLQALFKIKGLKKDTETDIIVEMDDGHQFRIMAKGSEQRVRGLKWDYKRPDLIVCDDIEDDELVLNQDRREKFRNWFDKALLPIRSDNGIVRMVGTVMHMDAVLERLMPKDFQKTTVIEPLKMYSTEKRYVWKSVKYQACTEDFKTILWPEKISEEVLRGHYARYQAQGNPEGFYQEYLNKAIDPHHSFFRRADFIPMREADHEKYKQYYMACDLAISQKERADYTAIVVGGVDEFGYLYIVDVIRERLDGKEIIDALLALNKRYNCELVTMERGQIEKAIGPFLKTEMLETNSYMNMNLVTPTKDKQQRARSWQARMRAGTVLFDTKADWYLAFEQEHLRFPRDRHDDQVDAAAYLGLTLDKFINAPTEEDLIEEEYTREYNETMRPLGRSMIGGY
jgi:predicted phage terminase large subunit-like protein